MITPNTNTVIVRIPKTEQSALNYACALTGTNVNFYTDERANGICFAEIQSDNETALFHIAFIAGRKSYEEMVKDVLTEIEPVPVFEQLAEITKP